jgi:hypothetical protein
MRNLLSLPISFSFASTSIPVVSLAPYLKGTGNWRDTAAQVRQICK